MTCYAKSYSKSEFDWSSREKIPFRIEIETQKKITKFAL